MAQLDLATLSINADHSNEPAVAPPISVTTTFVHPSPDEVASKPDGYYSHNWDPLNPSRDIYSREGQPVLTRVEQVMTAIIGQPTLVYPSGISAFNAILLHVRPDVIAITGGYHGCHGCIEVYRRLRGEDQVQLIKLEDDYPKDKNLLVWLETPLNPTGEVRSIKAFADKAHAVGGILGTDSTFSPPPTSDPFQWGADIVMHSATKYFAGHSDCLVGSVSIKSRDALRKLWDDRVYTGAVPGSLDAWLLLRSLRTLEVRVTRQSETATSLAAWLHSLTPAFDDTRSNDSGPKGVVAKVWHVTLQENAEELIGPDKQMKMGNACFSILMAKPIYAKHLGHALNLFIHATSLGGVESLIEHRIISDSNADFCLMRLSIGMESFNDLKNDLIQGFNKVVEIEKRA